MRVEWLYDQPGVDEVLNSVHDKLLHLGIGFGLTVRQVKNLALKLYHVIQISAYAKKPREITYEELLGFLVSESHIEIPKRYLFGQGLMDFLISSEDNLGKEVSKILSVVTRQVDSYEPPALPKNIWPHHVVIKKIVSKFSQGIVNVVGGIGRGKTTLVLQGIGQDKKPVLWLSFRDLNSLKILNKLQLFTNFIIQSSQENIIVFDDFNPDDDLRILELEISRLFRIIKGRKSQLVIISYKTIPTRLARLLGLNFNECVRVLNFNEEDIGNFLKNQGCENKKIEQLSKYVFLQTSGHPQLVAARIAALKPYGFPVQGIGNIIGKPKEILNIQDEARATLKSVLTEPARNLLYKMSIVIPAIRRSTILRIANYGGNHGFPGEDLDLIIGPWVEQPSFGFFKVSPIIYGSAQEIFSPDRMEIIHAEIARSLTEEKTISIDEFNGILMHSILGKSDRETFIAAHKYLTSDAEVQAQISKVISWICFLGVGTNPNLLFSNESARYFFRLMQWDVASQEMPKELGNIALAFDSELEMGKTEDQSLYFIKFMWLMKKLMSSEYHPGMNNIIEFLIELSQLTDIISKIDSSLNSLLGAEPLYPALGRSAFSDLVSVAVVPKVNSVLRLQQLISAIDTLNTIERKKILEGFTTDDGELGYLFFGLWDEIIRKENDNIYDEFVKTLKTAISAGRRWNQVHWMRAATRIYSAVMDEKFGKSEDAKSIVNEIIGEIGSSHSLEDQIAVIDFNSNQYEKALVIWRRILPIWNADEMVEDMKPVFGLRNAAISAGNLEKWQESAKWFEEAIRRGKKFGNKHWNIGMLFDYGFALWKTESFSSALEKFENGVESLEALIYDHESFRDFALFKMTGGLLSHLVKPSEMAAAKPGMCSNSTPPKGLEELPPTRIEFIWIMLQELAERVNNYKLASRCFDKYKQNSNSFLQIRATKWLFSTAIRTGDLSELLNISLDHGRALERSVARMDHPIHEPDPPELFDLPTTEQIIGICRPMLLGGLICAISNKENIPNLLEKWNLSQNNTPSMLSKELEIIRSLVNNDSSDLFEIMVGGNATNERNQWATVLLLGKELNPAQTIHAQLRIIQWLSTYKSYWQELGNNFDLIIREKWEFFANRPFLLISPKVNADRIKKACNSKSKGWTSAAKILINAIPAVNVDVSSTVLEQVRRISMKME